MSESAPFDFREWQAQVGKLLDKQIFFVGGTEKSGTSWLQQLLDAHPEVVCAGEAHFAESLYPAMKETLEAHNARMLDAKENPLLSEIGKPHPVYEFPELQYVLVSAIAALLLKCARGRAARAIGERSPKNVRAFTGLVELFPQAKCIHIVRDPRDVGISCWYHARRNVAPDTRSSMLSKPEFVRQHIELWNQVVGGGVGFGEENPGAYKELRYEDLVDRTAPVLSELFHFLGVDDRIEVAERCAARASFETLSGGRRPGQENPDSFFRKGVAGDWKNHLDAETNAYVITKCGALMKRFGYI